MARKLHTIYRSAVSGRIVDAPYALAHPDTTTAETVDGSRAILREIRAVTRSNCDTLRALHEVSLLLDAAGVE